MKMRIARIERIGGHCALPAPSRRLFGGKGVAGAGAIPVVELVRGDLASRAAEKIVLLRAQRHISEAGELSGIEACPRQESRWNPEDQRRYRSLLEQADYVVMESTYGDRNHTEVWSYTDELAEIIDETLGKGGNVVIPSFAVGRTQELLYFIREIKDQGLVKSVPDFPVYIDSPLAKAATTVFCGGLHGYLDEAALELVKDGTHMFSFPNLHLVETTEESRMLNLDKTPKIIISASGMCDAGRIRHHLKHNLWRANSAVVFVGFQSPGTLGRKLLDGAESVKLFGEEIAVRAKVVNFQGLSSHADHDHLIEWIKAFDPKPAHVFVVHGDADVAPVFADELCSLGFSAHAAKFTESYDLAAGVMLSEGYISERKRTMQSSRADNLYGKLLAAGEALLELIRRFKGRSNKEITAFTGQITALIDRFQ